MSIKIVRYYPRAVVGNGSMSSAVPRWSESLVRAGAEVVVVHAGGGTPFPGPMHWVSVPHRGGFGFTAPIGLAGVIRDADVLVLHSGWTLHNVVAAAIARSLHVPYVLEPRGAYDLRIIRRRRVLKKAWWLALERTLVSRASAIHVFFESERAHLEALVTPYPLGVYMGDAGGAVLCEASIPGPLPRYRVLKDRDSMVEIARTGARVARERLQWDAVGRSWLTQLERVL